MKDHIKPKLMNCCTFAEVKAEIDDYIDYCNNERYQWNLAKLSPNEFFQFCTTGKYPLEVPNIPPIPTVEKGTNYYNHRRYQKRLDCMIPMKYREYLQKQAA